MDHLIDDSDRLKPCPFCGGAAEMHQAHDPDGPNDQGYYVECGKCGASTNLRFSCGEDARPLLMEQWNRRTQDAEALKSERRATVQLRAMHAALSAAEKTPRDPLEIEELWDEANDLREKYDEYGPEVYELFARLLERSHGIGAEHG